MQETVAMLAEAISVVQPKQLTMLHSDAVAVDHPDSAAQVPFVQQAARPLVVYGRQPIFSFSSF